MTLLEHTAAKLEEEGSLLGHRCSVESLLDGISGNGHHGNASILDLLELHLHLTGLVLGEESQRVETAITRNVVLALLVLGQLGLDLENTRERHDHDPVFGIDLVQAAVEDGGRFPGGGECGLEAHGGGQGLVPELGKGPAGGGEHGKASRIA